MKNSILMAGLVLAVALVPSFAAALSTPYDVGVGQIGRYVVPGTLLNPPTLNQSEGTAAIVSATFDSNTMKWTVDVECLSSSTGRCKGTIES